MDSFTSALLAQFAAVAPDAEPQIKPLPLPPEEVRELLEPTQEHQSEAI